MNTKISIIVESFDLQKSAITSRVNQHDTQSIHSSNRVSPFRLPKKRTLYTVLRSPHIDKKSREQFEMKSHKQLFVIHTNRTNVHKHLLDLKLHSVSGVQVKVVLNYQTRLF